MVLFIVLFFDEMLMMEIKIDILVSFGGAKIRIVTQCVNPFKED
jgi:hypothetical protein